MYNVLGTTSAARCSQIHYSMLQQITSFVLAFWLHALLDPGIGLKHFRCLVHAGLKMDYETIRIAAGFRLGAPCAHVCVCGTTVTVDGHRGSGRHCRHNQLNDLLCRAFTSTGTLVTREPHSFCTSGGKRPDGVTQVPWKRGRYVLRGTPHAHDSSTLAGSAASAAELNKIAKYTDIIAGVDFVPFVIETSGLSRK